MFKINVKYFTYVKYFSKIIGTGYSSKNALVLLHPSFQRHILQHGPEVTVLESIYEDWF